MLKWKRPLLLSQRLQKNTSVPFCLCFSKSIYRATWTGMGKMGTPHANYLQWVPLGSMGLARKQERLTVCRYICVILNLLKKYYVYNFHKTHLDGGLSLFWAELQSISAFLKHEAPEPGPCSTYWLLYTESYTGCNAYSRCLINAVLHFTGQEDASYMCAVNCVSQGCVELREGNRLTV